jgi:RNA recognition motif-containing protein
MRSTSGIARITFLLLGASSLTQAWVPTLIDGTKFQRKSTTRLEERRFAQAQTAKKYGGDAKLATAHKERIRNAGRVGTKRFVDPCKVFVGNLPFNIDEKQMVHFVLSTMGQSKLAVHYSKVIYDWKTGKSKGYGFMVFTEPIYATVCMEVCNGKMLDGRAMSVSQGKKKEQDSQLYLKKKRKEPEDEEEAVISSALEQAESDEDDVPFFGGSDDDLELDAKLFGLLNDDDDFEYDGVFLENPSKFKEDEDPDLNREQRRDAARRRKKTKLPHKGFAPIL